MNQGQVPVEERRPERIGKNDHGPDSVGSISVSAKPDLFGAVSDNRLVIIKIFIQEITVTQSKSG